MRTDCDSSPRWRKTTALAAACCVALFAAARYAEASQMLHIALILDPNLSKCYLNLGCTYARVGAPELASATFEAMKKTTQTRAQCNPL